jgi:hypothetical protein
MLRSPIAIPSTFLFVIALDGCDAPAPGPGPGGTLDVADGPEDPTLDEGDDDPTRVDPPPDGPDEEAPWEPADPAGDPDEPPAAPADWESLEILADDGEIVFEKVSYRSEGLLVWGQVCRPAGDGPHPVAVLNHGGFEGLGLEWRGGLCGLVARRGWAVIESSYRGEDGSEGAIEACQGEVTDVLSMIDVAFAQPWADPDRAVMLGMSHGGCITTRAIQRGAPVQAAAELFGPSDWTALHHLWQAWIDTGLLLPNVLVYQYFMGPLETALGGSPDEVPDEYVDRSPSTYAADLAAWPHPFLIVHGAGDWLVPVSHSCNLAAATGGFAAYHLNLFLWEYDWVPWGCEDAGLDWRTSALPRGSWPDDRTLVVYDGVGHGDGLPSLAMLDDVLDFLGARLPPE